MASEEKHLEDNKPPVLGSWRKLYLLVMGVLAFQILIYYAITKSFE